MQKVCDSICLCVRNIAAQRLVSFLAELLCTCASAYSMCMCAPSHYIWLFFPDHMLCSTLHDLQYHEPNIFSSSSSFFFSLTEQLV